MCEICGKVVGYIIQSFYLRVKYTTTMNKVLFLDIDGVINSIDNIYCRTALWKLSNEKKSCDRFGQLFDERCVMWLEFIVKKTRCDIVISSTWRRSGLSVMQEMWDERNLPGNVIDITPTSVDRELIERFPSNKADRGYEIQAWIERFNPELYCIVDDDSDMLEHQNFVQTNSRQGLNYETAHMVVKVLNNI